MKIRALLLLSTLCFGAPSSCVQFFPNSQRPDTVEKIDEICFIGYTVGYSETYKNPLYSAEVLSPDSMKNAKAIPRKDAFHQEPRIPANAQSSLSAYLKSGYDRGHMTPAADMQTKDSQTEGFSIVNMSPQKPDTNRKVWKNLEAYVRYLGVTYSKVYAISGPIFSKSDSKLSDGTVIPSSFFKIAYVPDQKLVSAFIVKNDGSQTYDIVPVTRIESLANMRFSEIPDNLKQKSSMLPLPKGKKTYAQ